MITTKNTKYISFLQVCTVFFLNRYRNRPRKSETIIKFQSIWDDEIQKKINSFRNDDERMQRNLMDRSTNMVS